jgi:hypothetical protein
MFLFVQLHHPSFRRLQKYQIARVSCAMDAYICMVEALPLSTCSLHGDESMTHCPPAAVSKGTQPGGTDASTLRTAMPSHAEATSHRLVRGHL